MTDHELEQRLRSWYQGEVGANETAPLALRADLAAIVAPQPALTRLLGGRRAVTLVAAAAILATLLVVGAIAVGTALLREPALVPPTDDALAIESPGPSPSGLPSLPPDTAFPIGQETFTGLDQVYLGPDSVGWVTTASGIFRSEDMGATWAQLQPPGWSTTSAADLVDADTMYVTSDSMPMRIAATHDGGRTWVQSTIADPSSAGKPTISFQTPFKGFLTFGDEQGDRHLRVFATTDGGATWTGPKAGRVPVIEASMGKIEGPSGGVLYLYSGKYDNKPFNNDIVWSMDGGATWQTRTFPIGDGSRKNDQKFIQWISLADAGRIVMAISAGDEPPSVWQSDDDGRSWRLLKALPSEIAGMAADFVSPTEWILYQEDGSAVRSTVDGGVTWRTTTGTDLSIRLDKVSFASPDLGWAVEQCRDFSPTDPYCDGKTGDTAVFATTDGGRTWTRIGQPTVAPSPTPTPLASSDGSAWTSAGTMLGGATGGRGAGLSAFRLHDGRVLVVAGQGAPGSAELYDPVSGLWTSTMPLIHSRDVFPPAALLQDGRVLIFGGVSSVGGEELSAEIFDPETGRWDGAGKVPAWLVSSTTVVLPDGRMLAVGGWRPPDGTGSAGIYDPSTGRWAATATPMRYGGYPSVTLLKNGRVLIAGGADGEGRPLASAELYDPSNDTWTATGNMMAPRAEQTATLLQDGRVLVAGGAKTFAGKGLPSAEIYDPSTGTWTATGSMSEARGGFTATLLEDGRVLVAGGYAEHPFAETVGERAELYDPNTGTWIATAGMAVQRAGHVATLLSDGSVLVAGGFEPGSTYDDWLATAERYRPGTPTSPSP